MRHESLLVMALLALALALAFGCGGSQPPARSAASAAPGSTAAPGGQAAPGQEQWNAVLAAAQQEAKVVVDVPGEAIDQYRVAFRDFRQRYGIEVEARPGGNADTTQLIMRECAVGRPSLDVALGGMSEALEAYPRGCLTPLGPRLILPGVTDASKWRGAHLKFNDPEN